MWQMKKNELDLSKVLVEESLFTLGNGYLGIRGSFEEGYGSDEICSNNASYINGLYDRVPISYGEYAYGFPLVQDKQPRIVDTQNCQIYLDGERVNLSNGQHSNYERILDFKAGVSTRKYHYETTIGKSAKISFIRLASLWVKNIFIYKIDVEYDGDIELRCSVCTDIKNSGYISDPRVHAQDVKLLNNIFLKSKANKIHCLMQTLKTKIHQATVIDHRVVSNTPYEINHEIDGQTAITSIKSTQSMSLEKHCYFTDGIRFIDPYDEAVSLSQKYADTPFKEFLSAQADFLAEFWSHSDVKIDSNDDIQTSIRFNIYQLLQSVGPDKYSNISAKGLSGEGYNGHYFWDTEIYVLPFLQMTQPHMARSLLEYRYNTLPFAKNRAMELGHNKGAAYPWRTISGEECSAYFPAGTAQYHINADIAFAFIQYHQFNADYDFLAKMGAEAIIETARIWLEIGNFSNDQFMINSVTGPDEYTAIVNNNYYTNLLAKYHLKFASKLFDEFKTVKTESLKTAFEKLCMRISFTKKEALHMKEASDAMCLPYDKELGIFEQDDSFLKKAMWPFSETDKSHYPLLLHYHPLTIYRHQVIKQADTVLAHFLLEDGIDEASIKASFDYYEKITTHDSSLSACIYGIMASRCGYLEKAYDYFKESINLDIKNTHSNTKDGLHMANCAGAVLSIINGFSGFRISQRGISFRPYLPKNWKSYSFKIKYLNREIEVSVSDNIKFTLLSGEPIPITVWGKSIKLKDQLIFDKKKDIS
ncbi:MAG TPA: glycosyl hydrolase family 65 protein [Clostridia bacterium]|nr:glycosyl hydrolase family 65 protein [Clostridia bacterium]